MRSIQLKKVLAMAAAVHEILCQTATSCATYVTLVMVLMPVPAMRSGVATGCIKERGMHQNGSRKRVQLDGN